MTTLNIDATTTYTKDAHKIRPKLPVWCYETLKSTANAMNRRYSQGMVVSEIMFMYGYSSRLTDIETTIDRQLDSELYDGFAGDLDNVRVRGKSGQDLLAEGDIEGVDEPDVLTSHQINLWLPPHLVEEMPGRNIGVEIGDAMMHFYESPYRSVSDCLIAKTQILDYVQIGETPSHPVARAVCLGADEGLLDIPEATVRPRSSPRPSPGSDEVEQEAEEEWWESDDLTFEDLFTRKHTGSGDGLSQKQRDERITAIENAMMNEENGLTRLDVRKRIRSVFDISTESTLDSYLSDIDADLYADPLDRPIVAEIGYDNLANFDVYADNPDKQAETLDKLFAQYREETGASEYFVASADNMEGNWMPLVQVMLNAGWLSKSELPDDARTFFRDHVVPIFNESDYTAENVFATSKSLDRIFLSEDILDEGWSKNNMGNFNLYK